MRKFRNIVYVGSSTLLQTVNVDLEAVSKTIPNWNVWVQGTAHNALFNSLGATTSLSLQDISGTYAADDPAQGYPIPENSEFPNSVLENMMYVEAGTTKVFRLEGCSTSRKYGFKFGIWGAFDELYSDSKTNITVAGVTNTVLVTRGQMFYSTEFTNISPNGSGQIQITIAGLNAGDYPGLNAFIIKEYSS